MTARWVVVAALVACADGDGGTSVGNCPSPPDVNIVCAQIQDYGTADFRLREATGTSIRSGAEGTGGQRDGMNLQLAQGNPGEVGQGLFMCADQPIGIDFREAAGSDGETTYRQDPDAEGECFIQVTQGGVLGTDVVQGTFGATLRAGEGETRTVSGSFHVGAGAGS